MIDSIRKKSEILLKRLFQKDYYKQFYIYSTILVFLIIILGNITNPIMDHGDRFSDRGVLNSGENFYNYGFAPTKGFPSFEIIESKEQLTPENTYHHYPPLPSIINGILRYLGFHSILSFRFFFIGLSIIVSFLIYKVFYKLSNHRKISYLASFFFVCNLAFMEYADSIHQHTFLMLNFTIYTIAFYHILHEDKLSKKIQWWMLAAIVYFIDIWISFEHILMFGFLSFGLFLLKPSKKNFAFLFFMGLIPFLSLGSRALHHISSFGYEYFINDSITTFKSRGPGTTDDTNIKAALGFLFRLGWGFTYSVIPYKYIPGYAFESFVYHYAYIPEYVYYIPPLLNKNIFFSFSIFVGVYFYIKRKVVSPQIKNYTKLFLVLWIAGISWFFVIRGHGVSIGHHHPMNLLLPAVAFLFGALLFGAIRLFKYTFYKKKYVLFGLMFISLWIFTKAYSSYISYGYLLNGLIPIQKKLANNIREYRKYIRYETKEPLQNVKAVIEKQR